MANQPVSIKNRNRKGAGGLGQPQQRQQIRMKNFLMSRHYNFKFVAQIIIKVCVCELNNILKLIYEPGVGIQMPQ